MIRSKVGPREVPFIYNLFPPLAGEAAGWMAHVKRAAKMGFNWIFLNPIQYPGESGSIYSIRDYDRLNPLFFPQGSMEEQFAAFQSFIEASRAAGMEVMVDLVINHTAHDSPLLKEHPQWFKWLADGTIAHPGAMDNGHWVLWGDLAEIDNANSPDKSGLYGYWWQRMKEMLDRGVRGFRCDAAYKVPLPLWRLLIGRAREEAPDAVFFAETLGCPFEDNLALTEAGFDFTFNSGKWWNYRDDWFLHQLRDGCGRTRSISFPESHDTERLMEEFRGDVPRVEQHYAFTALIASGVMIVLGFEYGFRKRPHVVKTRPGDWEGISDDLTEFIARVNALKVARRLFQEDNSVERVEIGTENVLALKKTALDGKESAALLLNRYGHKHTVSAGGLAKAISFRNAEALVGAFTRQEDAFVLDPWALILLEP
ncbi:MAG: alpha-amylase family glycosyl hydrolase [Planctomycetota bacterium]